MSTVNISDVFYIFFMIKRKLKLKLQKTLSYLVNQLVIKKKNE